ncbi:POU class 2 homeobox associating factor 3 [Hyperolius riggenbachi]|uniref:POU class 2 homeobox associating factor 3 n=1 Tax=Hyperolius riggenbachi TaxID=752182 RepID=UPI0035A2BE64
MQFSDSVPPSPECYSACAPITSVAGYPQTLPVTYYEVQEESASFLDQMTLDQYVPPDSTVVDNSFCDIQPIFPTFSEGSIQSFPIFQQNMISQSPSDSSDRSNSFEYSPTCQEFVPQSYSPPSHLEPPSDGYTGMDQSAYQHQDNSTFCYCVYCCSADYQTSTREQDTFSYANTDYMGYLSEDIFTRDMSTYDVCYV